MQCTKISSRTNLSFVFGFLLAMVLLLVQKIDKLFSKLENFHHHHHHHHHNHHQNDLLASLEAFQTLVSNSLKKLLSNSKSSDSQVPSFPWIQQCFELIPIINNGFAKLVVAVDYPMTKWEADSVEEYLNYTLILLELCNSITCSVSQLGKQRLSLSHGLNLVKESSPPSLALEHLKKIQIQPKSLSREVIRIVGNEEHGMDKFSYISKESVVHQALVVMEGIVFWAYGILMSDLVGDSKPFKEMRESGGKILTSLIAGLDLSVCEERVVKGSVLKEVKETNDSVSTLVCAIEIGKQSQAEAEELQRRLEVFEKMVEGLGKEVDCLFNKVLAGRNQVLNGFQQQKK